MIKNYILRLYWICCWCGHMVLDQLNEMEDVNKLYGKKKIVDDGGENSSIWHTENISNDDYKMKTNGNELSIDTTVAAKMEVTNY